MNDIRPVQDELLCTIRKSGFSESSSEAMKRLLHNYALYRILYKYGKITNAVDASFKEVYQKMEAYCNLATRFGVKLIQHNIWLHLLAQPAQTDIKFALKFLWAIYMTNNFVANEQPREPTAPYFFTWLKIQYGFRKFYFEQNACGKIYALFYPYGWDKYSDDQLSDVIHFQEELSTWFEDKQHELFTVSSIDAAISIRDSIVVPCNHMLNQCVIC